MALALIALASSSTFLPVTYADAGARTANCLLRVDGRTYLDKPCRFEADPDGSFSIGTAATDGAKREPFFAYVNVNPDGSADATWNEDASASHAQAPLGTMKRHGACWKNARAEVCAR